MLKVLLSLLTGLVLNSTCQAEASEVRLDLYKKITKDTGVSLKEAFQALNDQNKSAVINLQIYAKKSGGTKDLEKQYEADISRQEKTCEKRKTASCKKIVQRMQTQLSSLRDLAKNYDQQKEHKKLYYSLVVYSFKITNKVLHEDLMAWDKACSAKEKINTKVCKSKIAEIYALIEIATAIEQAASLKPEKNAESLKSIEEKISKYEKL